MGYIPQQEGGSLVFHPRLDMYDFFSTNPNAHPLVFTFLSTAEVVISRKNHHRDVRLKKMNIPLTTDNTRSIRRHNVTWHRRELPDGWHASPAAYELAKELGVTLKPGETIVKGHERGSELLGRVTAYKLIRRPEE